MDVKAVFVRASVPKKPINHIVRHEVYTKKVCPIELLFTDKRTRGQGKGQKTPQLQRMDEMDLCFHRQKPSCYFFMCSYLSLSSSLVLFDPILKSTSTRQMLSDVRTWLFKSNFLLYTILLLRVRLRYSLLYFCLHQECSGGMCL